MRLLMGPLWPIVVRSLRARPLRALLSSVAVALGVAVILGVQLTLAGLDTQAHAAADARAGASGLDVRSPSDQGITTAQLAALNRLPGIVRAEPLYEKRVTARATAEAPGFEATLVSVSRGSTSGLRPVTVISGALPRHGARDEVAVDSALTGALVESTTRHALRVGDPIILTTVTGPDTFRIVGITSGTSGGAAFSESSVFVSDATLISNFSLGLRTPLVALELSAGIRSADVAHAVRTRLGGAVSTNDPRAGVARPLDQMRPMLVLITVLSMIVGGGVTANSVSLSVLERRREIGLLRAAGAGPGQVYRIFVAEGALCSFAGALAGIVLGILLGAVLIATRTASIAPGAQAAPLQIDPAVVILIALLGMFTALLGGSIPAVGAARTAPLNAIRPAPNAGRERPSRVLLAASPILLLASIPLLLGSTGGTVAAGAGVLLAGLCASLPIVGPAVLTGTAFLVSPVAGQARLAAANLSRRRNRTALTTAGLVVSVATAVAVSVLTGGALSASDHWINRLLVGDTIVHSGVAQPSAIATTFSSQHGVRQVSPLRFFSELIGGQATGFTAIDPDIYLRNNGFDFIDGDRNGALRRMRSEPGVLVPRQMATARDLRVGSTLVAGTGAGAVRLHVVGVIDHSFPTADGLESILIAQPVALTEFGRAAGGFNDLQLVSDGAQFASIQDTASRFGMQATRVATIRDGSQRALEHVIGLLLALSTIAVAIAMLAVVNTLLVNVRQSTREIGLLRAVGMARNRARSLLLTEAALLAGTGALIGIGAGCLLSLPMLEVSANGGFQPEFTFPVETAAVTVTTVMVAAILAALVPARRAAGAGIVSAIRHE